MIGEQETATFYGERNVGGGDMQRFTEEDVPVLVNNASSHQEIDPTAAGFEYVVQWSEVFDGYSALGDDPAAGFGDDDYISMPWLDDGRGQKLHVSPRIRPAGGAGWVTAYIRPTGAADNRQ